MHASAIRIGRLAPVIVFLALIALTACETPTEAGLETTPLNRSETAMLGMEGTTGTTDAIILNADGTASPYTALETEVTAEPGAQRTAMTITGRTTYFSGQVATLRMNVRMNADGSLAGGGHATIMGHEIDFTPTCIKENSGFGTPFYGVNVEFAEPLPYYTTSYRYGTISVADGGELSSLILGNAPSCRASSMLYPYEPMNGAINVLFMN